MRPENLKSPFKRGERYPLIQDHVWYLPELYKSEEAFSFSGWSQVFAREQPICIEYCSGNGAWIAAKAQEMPHYNWVAVEYKFDRVQKIWSKLKNHQLSNLFIVCAEAHMATHHYFPSESVEAVYINFPDPWPKKRHAKYRLIHPSFVEEIGRILKKDKQLTMVTDDEEYSKIMINVVSEEPCFESLFEEGFASDYPGYGTSYFEALWREKGKMIRYHVFRKKMSE